MRICKFFHSVYTTLKHGVKVGFYAFVELM